MGLGGFCMESKELEEKVEKYEENSNSTNENVSIEEMHQRAMMEYLGDVVPVSEFINRSFEEIDAKRLNKKEGKK